MSRIAALANAVTTHTRLVLAFCLVLTLVLGAGLAALETETSLEQFETDTPESDALTTADERFAEVDENTTTVQVVVSAENALERDALLDGLRFQQSVLEDDDIEPTLVEEEPVVGVENVLATALIRLDEVDALEARAADLEADAEAVESDIERLEAALESVAATQASYEVLNDSYEHEEIDEDEYDRRSAELEASISTTVDNATAPLEPDQQDAFEDAAARLRGLEAERAQYERDLADGEINQATYDALIDRLEDEREQTIRDGSQWVFSEELSALQTRADDLEDEREEIERLEQPPLEEQIDALKEATDADFEAAVTTVLGEDGPGSEEALRLLPSSYEPGALEADERLVVITQSFDRSAEMGEPGPVANDAQMELTDRVQSWNDDTLVFGFATVSNAVDQAVTDSLVLVGPLAVAFVILTLTVAYRDPLDIALGVAGIGLVLVWTFGLAGWAEIAFTQVFVAVPVLLIGLSIDYAIHVVMRYRERREEAPLGTAMTLALGGVGLALLWVTATTAAGFLANLVSPIAPIREFGLVSAVGIVASVVVFGAVIPACKLTLDGTLEARGFDRTRRPLGGGDRLGHALTLGSTLARRAPVVVVLCALVVTAGGVYGATQVDTTFEEDDFFPDEPPLGETLGPFGGDAYQVQSILAHLEANYQRGDGRAQIVATGAVTDGQMLQRVATAEAYANESDVVYVLPGNESDVRSPLSMMQETKPESDSFNASFQLADRTEDGVPDQNVEGLYDGLLEANPGATDVVYRTEAGEYESIRLLVGIDGAASNEAVAAEMDAIVGILESDEDGQGGDIDAIATGEPVVTYALERTVFQSIVHGLAVAMAAVLAFLVIGFSIRGQGPTLGVVTTIPVVVALGATVLTMAVTGVPFNLLTGTVASLTIGLGVAYAIHVSVRYVAALEAGNDPWSALDHTMTYTGSALAGSAVTTIAGFGVLVVAVVPLLRQFGLVTAMTIGFAFLASVGVLPTLLILWTRYLAPEPYRSETLEIGLPAWIRARCDTSANDAE